MDPTSYADRLARRWIVAVVGIASVLAGCNSVLGLDPPQLDPCAAGTCADAEAGADGAHDAANAPVDAGPSFPVRCGGGQFPVTVCSDNAPVCCQIHDAGSVSYECRPSAAACEGYPIACTNYNDCPGQTICCKTATQVLCRDRNVCANADIVCDPNGAGDQCKSGSCTAQVVLSGVPSPYSGCQ